MTKRKRGSGIFSKSHPEWGELEILQVMKKNVSVRFLLNGWCQQEAIVDRSPLKQGRYTPGTHIPIVAPEWIEQQRPDVLLLLAWNFAAEIVSQQTAFLEAGGRFLLPLPEVRMLDETPS